MRSYWSGLGLMLGAASILAPMSCSSASKGALVLAISTDMRTPKDINIVSVFITTNGVPKFDYLGRVLPDGTVALPATVAVVEPDDPSAKVRIRVTAFEEANARVLRDVLTTVPHQTTSLLRLPLNFLDDGSGMGAIPADLVPGGLNSMGGAPDGDTVFDVTSLRSSCDFNQGLTSINGQCKSDVVDSTTLPPYVPEAVYGDGGLMANGAPMSCFDVAACFHGAVPVTGVTGGDTQECTAPLPAGLDASSVNLALVTPATGECLAPGQCYVPLENDPTEGFTVSGGTLHMIPGICAKITAGAQLYAASGACAPKALSEPVCEPVVGGSGADAGVAADASTNPCDGSYVIDCASNAQCGGGATPVVVSGTTATLSVPVNNGNGGNTTTTLTATVDPTTCVMSLTIPPDDGGSCSPVGTFMIDLSAATTSNVPCASGSSDGQCTNTMLTCAITRGAFDGGTGTMSGDAGTIGTGVSGSVAGIGITPQDSTFASGFLTVGGSDISSSNAVLAVLLSDSVGLCTVQQEALAGSDQKASSTQLSLAIQRSGSAPIGAGTYPINADTTSFQSLAPNQMWGFASLTQTTPTCGFNPSTTTGGLPDSQAVSGSITIDQVTTSSVSGSFDLNFPNGVLSGAFVAPSCSGVDLQNLFLTSGATLGQGGPDSSGICYGDFGAAPQTDAGPADSGILFPDTGIGGGDAGGPPPPFDSGTSQDASFGDAVAGGACFLLPPGAVSWWRAEGDGSDVLGNNPAAWVGPASFGPGIVGNAFLFNGASYLTAGVNGLSFGSGGTAEGWVQVGSIPAMSADLFGFGTTTQTMDTGGMTAAGLGSTWDADFTLNGQTLTGENFTTGSWAHVAVVWSAASDAGVEQVDFYVDGSLFQTAPMSIADAGVPATFLMGGEGSGAASLTGLVDEVTLYDTQLTPAQIASIYVAGTGGKCQCQVATDCPAQKPTCQAGFCQ
jgi:hypothetical protein